RPECLWNRGFVYQFIHRTADPLRLHLGTDPPHAGRHPPPDLGHRSRLLADRTGGTCARDDRGVRAAHGLAVGGGLSDGWRRAMSAERLRTPLARVRGLGSARSGTEHFWRQRLTAVANVPLTIAFVVIVVSLLGRNHAAVVSTLGSPLIALVMLL